MIPAHAPRSQTLLVAMKNSRDIPSAVEYANDFDTFLECLIENQPFLKPGYR
jgi:hypothetical protein